jgi:DNA-binding MarR family transcriptional regulator
MSPIIPKSDDNVNQKRDTHLDGVLDLIHTIMHQFRSQQFQALREDSHDLTPMESRVLGFFERHPGSTQSDLARHSGRDKAQVTRLIAGLRERGLLQGEADTADRRNTRLSLTEAGLAAQRQIKRHAEALNVQALQGLSAEQQQNLQELLRQVKANLD